MDPSTYAIAHRIDYMYYKKQQAKMEEDTHKQVMYNRKCIYQPETMSVLSP